MHPWWQWGLLCRFHAKNSGHIYWEDQEVHTWWEISRSMMCDLPSTSHDCFASLRLFFCWCRWGRVFDNHFEGCYPQTESQKHHWYYSGRWFSLSLTSSLLSSLRLFLPPIYPPSFSLPPSHSLPLSFFLPPALQALLTWLISYTNRSWMILWSTTLQWTKWECNILCEHYLLTLTLHLEIYNFSGDFFF